MLKNSLPTLSLAVSLAVAAHADRRPSPEQETEVAAFIFLILFVVLSIGLAILSVILVRGISAGKNRGRVISAGYLGAGIPYLLLAQPFSGFYDSVDSAISSFLVPILGSSIFAAVATAFYIQGRSTSTSSAEKGGDAQ